MTIRIFREVVHYCKVLWNGLGRGSGAWIVGLKGPLWSVLADGVTEAERVALDGLLMTGR